MKYAVGFLAALLAMVLAALAVMYSGAINVAASAPHTALGAWILDTTMQRSVEARAEASPSRRFTPQQVRAGFREYDSECAMCHGAPGVERTEWAKGLRPQPPDLSREVGQWTSSELHWIVTNGVKMSAMPAMGSHHTDEEIWNIVAFIETLPGISPEQYRQMRGAPPSGGQHAGSHSH